ncbi:MAG TPA: bacteriocin-protection protein, partial [Archangium sp.]
MSPARNTMSPAKKAPAKAKTPVTKKTPAKAKTPEEETPIIAFAKPRDWGDWLASNHASSRGVWLKLAKKASGIESVTYAQALDVALAWGWIDGQKNSYDDTAWLQKFTPRGPKSIWSKINRDKALALIAAGEMKPPGLKQIERAKQDGRWEAAYDSPSRATVPEDLSAALAANPRAAA